jgi:hypothetical protein
VVTAASLVEVLRAGWSGSVPFLHPSVSDALPYSGAEPQ